jgi:hypothetical protein
MLRINKPFPFFLNDDRENFILIAVISAFIYFFVKVFKPFGALATTLNEVHIYSLITFVVLTFNIVLLPRIFPKFLDNANWTLRKYLVFNLYNMVVITFFIALSHYLTREPADMLPFHLAFLNDLWRTAAIGIMPLVAMTFLLEARLMAATLAAGNEATSRLRQLNQEPVELNEPPAMLSLQPGYSDSLAIPESQFLFAQAENNYSQLYIRTSEGMRKQLVRIFIKDLAEQTATGYIVRCHRSYVVNLRQVDRVTGNANGYRLHFEDSEKSVPVSRAMGKEILRMIDEMSAPDH